VGQFSFECCPLVQKISSAIHYLPCFGSGLLLCFCIGVSALGVYFFALPPFSGTGSVFQLPLNCPCFITVYYLLFSFAGQFCFGFCSLAQEMMSVIYYLPCFMVWLITLLPSVFTAFPAFVY
jgi:hypothetical protein